MSRLMTLGIFVLVCVACASFQERFFEPGSSDDALFESAELKYLQKKYDAALVLYEQHARKFPDSKKAAQVLFRMGQIQMAAHQYEKARVFFQDVMERFPASPWASEARVETLSALYASGAYAEVIAAADRLGKTDLTSEQSFKWYMILGDAYYAMQSPLKAYHAWVTAQKSASSDEMPEIVTRLKTVIPRMSASDIRFELKQTPHDPPAGYLMFQLGLLYLEEGKKNEAFDTLSLFLKQYPHHEFAGEAQKLLSDRQPQAQTPVEEKTIGCLLPLSGKYATIGQQALKGVELALTVFAREQESVSIHILIKDNASQADMDG